MHKIQNIDKKFPAFSRDCWIILCFKLLNLGDAIVYGLLHANAVVCGPPSAGAVDIL